MVYRGHVANGVIRLEGAVVLPEGAEVRVEMATTPQAEISPQVRTIEDELCDIWADVSQAEWDRLPPDLTDNLDHYVYGTPK
jgi:predicted DNA-binding antitoxin AbrB/MazE fold protein